MFYLWEKNRQKLSCCRQKERTLLLFLLFLFILFVIKKTEEWEGSTTAIVRDSCHLVLERIKIEIEID